MKKFLGVITVILILCLMCGSVLTVSADETTTSAETTTVIETTAVAETTTKADNSKIYASFKDGNPFPQYVYTGKEIKPEVVVKTEDKIVVDKSEYTVEYLTDCKKPGNHDIAVTYNKNGYKVIITFRIITGKTDKINVNIKNGKVTVSWNPVPGAGVYRVYKYDEKNGYYTEMMWSDGQIASASTSRTFTSDELKPGGKYKMAIMALPAIESMPTDQMAYFTVDTTKDTETTQKPVTTEKNTEKPTATAPVTTKAEATTADEETGTTATETTMAEENTTAKTENTSGDKNASAEVQSEKDPIDKTKLIIILGVSLLAIAGIVFSVYKKKK